MTSLDDLVEDMARLTDAPCTLEDADFRLIGFSDHRSDGAIDAIRQASILQRHSSDDVRVWFRSQGIEDSPGPLRIPGDAGLGIVPRLCVPARHLDRVHGYFWLLDPDGHISADTWPEAARIAESAARLLSVAERRQGHRDAAFRELVEGPHLAARESAVDLAQAAGIELDDPVTCVLVERPEILDQVASRPSRTGVVWVRSGAGVACALTRADIVARAAGLDDLLGRLGLGRRIPDLDQHTHVATGPVADGIDDISIAHRGAAVALRVARTRPAGSLVAWESLGPLALLGLARDDDLANAVVAPGVRALLAPGHDDVVSTARVWLDEAGSVGRAAQRLAVHRQTVYHRLALVEKVTGFDLTRGADRLRLHLALELAPFLEQ